MSTDDISKARKRVAWSCVIAAGVGSLVALAFIVITDNNVMYTALYIGILSAAAALLGAGFHGGPLASGEVVPVQAHPYAKIEFFMAHLGIGFFIGGAQFFWVLIFYSGEIGPLVFVSVAATLLLMCYLALMSGIGAIVRRAIKLR